MNYYYDYNTFIKVVNDYKQQVQGENTESAKRILKALKDTMDAYDSVRELSIQEQNVVMGILMNSMAASYILNNK